MVTAYRSENQKPRRSGALRAKRLSLGDFAPMLSLFRFLALIALHRCPNRRVLQQLMDVLSPTLFRGFDKNFCFIVFHG